MNSHDHVHICQWCEQRYPGVTQLVEGENTDGRHMAVCDCLVTDECPGCSEHGACEACGEAPAGDERDLFKCSACADKTADSRNEAAYEASLDEFYGGSGSVSIREQMSAAYAVDKGQK